MNLPEVVHCAACGRSLGSQPSAKARAFICPRCSVPLASQLVTPRMESRSAGSPDVEEIAECPSCGGQFLEHASFRSILEGRLVLEGLGGARQTPLPPNGAPPSSHLGARPSYYLPCPICRGLMNRKNFGANSGVIVDVCRGHGVWFDRGELPAILAFVERGGLIEAERRGVEEQRRQAARLKEAHADYEAAMRRDSGVGRESGLLDALFELLRQ